MKKIHVLFFSSLIILSSCKKNADSSNREPRSPSIVENELGQELISIAQNNASFKKAIEEECLLQQRGDYNVSIAKILAIDLQQHFMSAQQRNKITALSNEMKTLKPGGMPILFIPVVEKFDPAADIYEGKTLADRYSSAAGNKNIICVPQDQTPTATDEYTGYSFAQSGNWEKHGLVNEKFAWSNDVWVTGYEENVSEENLVTGVKKASQPIDPIPVDARVDGRKEYGGRIQVTDIGAIESWVSGKLEFRYFVHSSTAIPIKERAFGKWARSNFTNQKWKDFDDFIGNWYVGTWGNVMYERWIEEDGGNTTTISQSVTPVAGGPSYTISSTFKDDDDNLGLAGVQFDDTYWGQVPLLPEYWRIYNISYMNFTRNSRL